jgi:hypothetical protein
MGVQVRIAHRKARSRIVFAEPPRNRYRPVMALRLLIAVGEAADHPDDLPPGVRELIGSADAIQVVSPRLPGRLQWLMSDTDKATEKADERLHTVLGQLDDLGAQAQGRVGSDDPLEAFGDAIRAFSPDHLLIGLRRRDRTGWQERGLLDAIQEQFAIPMTVFLLPDD